MLPAYQDNLGLYLLSQNQVWLVPPFTLQKSCSLDNNTTEDEDGAGVRRGKD